MERISQKKKLTRLVLLGCAVFLALVTSVMVSSISPVHAALKSGRHTLPGHIAPELKRYKLEHAMNKAHQLQLSISLNLRNLPALTALIAAQNDPSSASYPSLLDTTVDSVVSFLKSQGLHVRSVTPNKVLVDASGSVANVEQAFGVTLSDYILNGRTVYAPTSDPTVPTTLSTAILNVGGLDNIALYHHSGLAK